MFSKTLILCALLMCIIAVKCFPADYLVPAGATKDQEWECYKTFFNKKYDTPEEDAEHRAIFFKTKAKIEKHNKQFDAGKTTFKQGINQITDLSKVEFEKQYLSGIRMPEQEKNRKKCKSWSVPAGTSIDDEWALYKKHFEKYYADAAEDAKRKGIYLATKKEVEDHNKLYATSEVKFCKEINQFADLTREEFVQQHTGILPTP